MGRLLASLLILVGLHAPCSAAVTLGACGTETKSGSGVLTFDWTGTVGTLSNGALVAVVTGQGGANMSAMTAKWDPVGANQSMTQIVTVSGASTGLQVFIFGLRNPTAGPSKVIRVAWTGLGSIGVVGCTWEGVDQTNDATAFPNFNSASATAATGPTSVTITSATGDAVMAGHSSNQNFTAVNNTSIFLDNTGAAYAMAANRASGAATVALTASYTGSATWASAGTDIAAAAAGGAVCPSRALLGVGC